MRAPIRTRRREKIHRLYDSPIPTAPRSSSSAVHDGETVPQRRNAPQRLAGADAAAPVLSRAAGGREEEVQGRLVVERRLGQGGEVGGGERVGRARDVDVGAAVRGRDEGEGLVEGREDGV